MSYKYVLTFSALLASLALVMIAWVYYTDSSLSRPDYNTEPSDSPVCIGQEGLTWDDVEQTWQPCGKD